MRGEPTVRELAELVNTTRRILEIILDRISLLDIRIAEGVPAFEETCWHPSSAYLVYGRPQRRLAALA